MAESKRYQELDQLSDKEQQLARKIATAPPENGFGTHPENRYEGEARVQEVARVMVEGCMVGRYTLGCLECTLFDTGRSICMDVLKEEIDRL